MDKFLTVEELARRLGVARPTARAWLKRGLFPNALQVVKTGRGGVWLVPEGDLATFVRPPMGYPRGRPRKTRPTEEGETC